MHAESVAPPELLLGRADELMAIEVAAASAATGTGRLLFVEGPAGIGKTSLLRAAREALTGSDRRVLTARGFVLEGDYPYGIVRQLFDPVRLTEQAGWERALDGAAALARRAFDAADAAMFVDDAPYATRHGLFWLAANLAADQPLALLVDDAHWADAASVRWLLHLAWRLDGLPVLIIVAARNGPGAHAQAELAELQAAASDLLQPTPLDEAAVGQVVRARLGDSTGTEVCRACHQTTAGNPFLLESLLTALRTADSGSGTDMAALVRRVGPEPIARAVLRRVGLLSDGSLGLARALAVIARPSALRQVSALAGCDLMTAARLSDELRGADILVADPLLDFAHPIVRSAIYDAIPASERMLMHASAAILLRADGADPEQLAPHLMRLEPSGDADVAASLRAAGRAAFGRGTPGAAVALLRRAMLEPPGADDQPGTAFDLGLAMASVRDPAAPAALRAAVASLAGEPAYLPAAIRTAGILGVVGWHDAAAAVCRDVLESGQQLDPAGLEVLKAELAANALVTAEGISEARQLLAAVDPASPPSLHQQIVAVHVATLSGEPAPVNISALMSAVAAAGGEPPADSIIASYILLILIWNGALTLARQICARVIEEARSRGSRAMVTNLTSVSAVIAARLGLLQEAAADGMASFRIKMKMASQRVVVAWAAACYMEALIELGRLDEADQIATSALSAGPPAGYYHTLYLHQVIGKLRLAQRRPAECLDILLAAGAELARFGCDLLATTWRADAALACKALGRTADAAELATSNLRSARAAADPYSLAIALRTYVSCTDTGEAEQLLTEAVTMAQASESALSLAYALCDLGAYRRRAGRRSDARDPLRRALDLAHRCGARPLAERARRELTAAGARPRRMSVTGSAALTTAERRVADLAAGGLSNRQIAQHLFVTLPTVETHLRHAFQKLGITSRAQLPEHLTEPASASV
jgi:DNA-binding CsgD family transcriptional regulator